MKRLHYSLNCHFGVRFPWYRTGLTFTSPETVCSASFFSVVPFTLAKLVKKCKKKKATVKKSKTWLHLNKDLQNSFHEWRFIIPLSQIFHVKAWCWEEKWTLSKLRVLIQDVLSRLQPVAIWQESLDSLPSSPLKSYCQCWEALAELHRMSYLQHVYIW